MVSIIKNISADMLDYYIDSKEKKYVIVDVRRDYKYEKSHIKGAINIPYECLDDEIWRIKKGKVVVVYCERGGMSLMAAGKLIRAGFNVVNVVGGIKSYKGKNIV